MNINIENPSKEKFDFRGYKKLIGLVIDTVEKDKDIPNYFEVNILIVDEKEIKRINRETRGINKITDVLSFPYFSFERPGIFDKKTIFDPESILGDIIICSSRVKSQAGKFGHSQKRELAYLTLHSMLHLIGYDHIDEKDEKKMNAEADRLMKTMGIYR